MTAQKAIHGIAAAENDWMMCEDAGRELGHYPTRRGAEAIGRKIAQKRGVELVVQTQLERPCDPSRERDGSLGFFAR